MRLGHTNGIVDDSDFKPVDFDRPFQSNSKSSNDRDFDLKSMVFNLNSIYFDYKIDVKIEKFDLKIEKVN